MTDLIREIRRVDAMALTEIQARIGVAEGWKLMSMDEILNAIGYKLGKSKLSDDYEKKLYFALGALNYLRFYAVRLLMALNASKGEPEK